MTHNKQEHRSFALPIAIMFALFFMIAFVTGYQNPLGSVIKKMANNNIVLTQLGTLCNFIAYAFMGYPAGKLLQNKGYRVTALYAVTVGFIGVAVTYCSGMIDDNMTALTIYMAGAFIAGFSMCMLNTVVNPMLNSLGKNERQGNQLVQFGGTCNSLGATLAPMIVGGLIGGEAASISAANPVFYMAMGIFAAAFIVLYYSKLPESREFYQKEKREHIKALDAFKYRNFTFGVIAIFCYVGIEVCISNWAYQYLDTNSNLTVAKAAGAVCAIYWLLMLCGRFIGGLIGGKVTSRVMLMTTSALAIVLLILGITANEAQMVGFFGFDTLKFRFFSVTIPANAVYFILCGLCTSIMWGAIFNLSVQGLGKYTSVASGIFMAMVCGGGILPFIQSFIAGQSGILCSFWLVVVLAAYLLLYALLLSHPVSKLPESKEVLEEDGVKAEI